MKMLLITTALCAISTAAIADETVALRSIIHATAAQTYDVDDINGHTLTVAKFTGLVSFKDGTIGTTTVTATADYLKGNGAFTAYVSITADGSTFWVRQSGTATVDGNITHLKGPVVVISGNGKYAGVKGDGMRMQAQLASGAQNYNDCVINLKTAAVAGK
jgi:hypothetical protein